MRGVKGQRKGRGGREIISGGREIKSGRGERKFEQIIVNDSICRSDRWDKEKMTREALICKINLGLQKIPGLWLSY